MQQHYLAFDKARAADEVSSRIQGGCARRPQENGESVGRAQQNGDGAERAQQDGERAPRAQLLYRFVGRAQQAS